MIPVMMRFWMPRGSTGDYANSIYKDFRTGNDLGTYTTYGDNGYTTPDHFDTFTQGADGLTVRCAGGNRYAYVVFDDFDVPVDEFSLTVWASIQWTVFGSGSTEISIGHGENTPANAPSSTDLWFHRNIHTNSTINYTVNSASSTLSSGDLKKIQIVVSASDVKISVYVDDVLKLDNLDMATSPLYESGPIAFGMWRFLDSNGTVTFRDALLEYN